MSDHHNLTLSVIWLLNARSPIWRGYQSTRNRVISSHGHVVTRSTHHIHVPSHSQLVTSEHITKPPVPVVIICTPSGDVQKQCSTRTA